MPKIENRDSEKNLSANEQHILIHDKSNNPFFHHYNFFINNLTLLSKLNEIFSGTFDTYVNAMIKQDGGNITPEKITFGSMEENLEELMKKLTKIPLWHFGITNEFLEFVLSSSKGTFYLKENFHRFLREMILVNLVSQLELLLENNFIYVFGSIPDLLKSKEKTMDYEELLKLGSFDSISDRIVNKEAQSIIKEEIDKINQILNKKYEIMDLSTTPDWKKFKERFYRRNLIVHHMSFVDDTYRMKTGFTGKEKLLYLDDEYLKESISLFMKYAHVIHHAFVNKFIPIMEKQYRNSQSQN